MSWTPNHSLPRSISEARLTFRRRRFELEGLGQECAPRPLQHRSGGRPFLACTLWRSRRARVSRATFQIRRRVSRRVFSKPPLRGSPSGGGGRGKTSPHLRHTASVTTAFRATGLAFAAFVAARSAGPLFGHPPPSPVAAVIRPVEERPTTASGPCWRCPLWIPATVSLSTSNE